MIEDLAGSSEHEQSTEQSTEQQPQQPSYDQQEYVYAFVSLFERFLYNFLFYSEMNEVRARSRSRSPHSRPSVSGLKFCAECNKYFEASHFARHKQTHKKEKDLKCPNCGKMFAVNEYLRKHIKIHNADVTRKHICSICKSAFQSNANLLRHLKSH